MAPAICLDTPTAACYAVRKRREADKRMKHVLFTGATGGLGQVCVKALAETGRWRVYAAGTNREKLQSLGSLPNVIPLAMDITDEESVLAGQRTVARETPALDAVVNFAGASAFSSLVEGEAAALAGKLLEINVLGMIHVNRVFFEMVKAGGGRIVNCSSEAGWMTAQPFAGAYCLSKRAVEAYNDSLRRELMFLKIPVIKIQPGSFQTALTKGILLDFEDALLRTRYYAGVLQKLKPLMTQELSHKNDPRKLAAVVLRAMEAKHPRLRYRVGTGKLLLLLEIFPEKAVDLLYQTLVALIPDRKRRY